MILVAARLADRVDDDGTTCRIRTEAGGLHLYFGHLVIVNRLHGRAEVAWIGDVSAVGDQRYSAERRSVCAVGAERAARCNLRRIIG